MDLSIIIPAFNEEKELPGCLASALAAVDACGAGSITEIIVCDNNSTDRTSEVARTAGVRVVFEPFNQISRARNAGAAAAAGRWLLFIDADSRLSPRNLARVLEFAQGTSGVIGGGSVVGFDRIPWWVTPGVACWNLYSRVTSCAAGSFVFARADDFREVGGFSEELFAAEELDLSRKLKRCARRTGRRFVILRGSPHVSSGRKFRRFTPIELLGMLARFALHPRRVTRTREELGYFYDGRR